VFRVDDGDPRGWRPAEILEVQRDGFREPASFGRRDSTRRWRASRLCARDDDAIGVDVEACVAEPMKKCKVVEAALGMLRSASKPKPP